MVELFGLPLTLTFVGLLLLNDGERRAIKLTGGRRMTGEFTSGRIDKFAELFFVERTSRMLSVGRLIVPLYLCCSEIILSMLVDVAGVNALLNLLLRDWGVEFGGRIVLVDGFTKLLNIGGKL